MNPQNEQETGADGGVLSIRHHIYNIIRKGGRSSVKVPSSYDLARMFGTTRRVAQRELERLIFAGVLIGKPRIGTFTIPRPLDHPLFGVTVGNGDHFTWGDFELMALSEIYRELAHRPCFVHDLRIVGKSCGACVNELLSLDLNGVLWIGPIEWAKGHGQEFYEEVSRRGLPFVTYGIPHREGLSGIDFSYREALTELAERFGKEKRRKIRAFLASPFVYEAFSSVCAEYFPAEEFDFAFGSCERIDQFTSGLAKFLNGGIPDALLVSSGNLKEAAAFLESNDGWNTCRLVSLGPTTEMKTDVPYLFCDNPYREAARLAADLLVSFQEKPGQVVHFFVEKKLRAHALNGFRNADPTT